jgi:serine kinase of HPr protein (carbohydrate metabolism regulator)
MRRIKTDEEALKALMMLKEETYTTQKERDSIIYELNEYLAEITDLIYFTDQDLSPKEILKIAKEKNKPILL